MANSLLENALGIGGQIYGSFLQFGAAQQRAQTIIDGAAISAAASGMTAAGYRQSAEAVQKSLVFNQQIDEINLVRKMDAVRKQQRVAYGAQLTAQASSGFSLGSKSFLMVQNETRSFFETSLINTKVDAENARRAAEFESQVLQTKLENQARASEFQAASQRAIAEAQANQIKGQAVAGLAKTGINALGTLLGGN